MALLQKTNHKTLLMQPDIINMARVSVIMLILLPALTAQCPTNCHCSIHTTTCVSAQLRGIPLGLRNVTTKLMIWWDNITELTSDSFSQARLYNLSKLLLVRTNIFNVDKSTFQVLKHLKTLTIRRNKIQGLQRGTFQGLNILNILDLSFNKILNLPSYVFDGLKMLRHLSLNNNNIRILQRHVFSGMRDVNNCQSTGHILQVNSSLDLSSNRINLIEPGTFQDLCMFSLLYLRSNNLSTLQPDMFVGMTRLKLIDLDYNKFMTILTGSFNGLETLYRLSMERSTLNLHKEMFQGLLELRELIIYDCGVHKVVLPKLNNLTTLDMTSNKIQRIDSGTFNGFLSLRKLRLTSNSIQVLSVGAFMGAAALNELNLPNNKLEVLQSGIFQGLAELRTLNMQSNKIRMIQNGAFEGLGKLQNLNLKYNNIKALANGTFEDLHMLRILGLYRNKIERIETDAFRGLRSLKTLILSYNDIQELRNETFRDVVKLDHLDVTGNYKLILQPGAMQGLPAMKTISLSVNQINNSFSEPVSFPVLLNGVVSVKVLEVTGLYTILQPTTFTGFHLYDLDLSYNTISLIQKNTFVEVPGLRTLKLEGCNVLTIYPGTFEYLHDLLELTLSNNYITTLEPGVFQGLTSLTSLRLRRNRIIILDEGVFGAVPQEDITNPCTYVTRLSQDTGHGTSYELRSLRYLNLADNKIMFVHQHAFVHNLQLERLDLSGNKLLTLNTNFLYVPSLKELYMSRCNVTELLTDTFRCVPKLTALVFAINKIEALDVEFLKGFRYLKSIDLAANPLEFDCGLKEASIWLHDHHISNNDKIYNYNRTRPFLTWDSALSELQCNSSVYTVGHVTATDDLYFFKQFVEPSILGLILLIGVHGNGFLFYMFIHHPEIRTSPNACILNLAVGDFLSLLINLPLSYWDILTVTWELGSTLCKVFMSVRDLTVGVTVFTVVALSIQRYSIVSRSFKSERGFCGLSERKATGMLILLVWGFALGFALPAYLTATVDVRCLYATSDKEYIRRTWTIQLFVFCIAPLFIIGFLNFKTAQHLKKSVRTLPEANQETIQARGRLKVANMVVILTIVFFVSYTPNFLLRVLFVWSVIEPESESTFFLSFVSFCLFFCNSCFNPIALFSMSSTFKTLFLKYVRCGRVEPQQDSSRDNEIPQMVFRERRKLHTINTEESPQ